LTVFGSEASVKVLMENLPNKKMHDQTLVVLPYTKQSLTKLEEATKRFDQVINIIGTTHTKHQSLSII
jgi:hypothetical protein